MSTPFTLRRLLTPRTLRVLWSVFLFVLCAIGIALVLNKIPFADVVSAMRRLSPLGIVATALLLFFSQVLRGIRWWQLVRWEATTSFSQTWYALCGGQVINWLSPLRVGDIWRVTRVCETRHPVVGQSVSVFWAAASVLIEKSSDALALGLYALLLFFLPIPQDIPQGITRTIILAIALFLVVMALLALRPDRLQAQLVKRWGALERFNIVAPQAIQDQRNQHLRNPIQWLIFIVLCVVIYFNAVFTNVVLAYSMGMTTNITAHIFFFVLLMTGIATNMIPGNVLVHPTLSWLVFRYFAVDEATALAYGIVLYVLGYGVNLAQFFLLAIVMGWRTRRGK
jgi:uncharacterized membrane protein YbhN (UPF0104 family)